MTRPLMRRPDDKRPWGLILALMIAASAGVIGIPLQVAVLKQQGAASSADVRRAQELTSSLAQQQETNAREAKAFREDSRRLTLAICDQIEAVARQAQLEVPPCPRVATNPNPSPTPTSIPTPG